MFSVLKSKITSSLKRSMRQHGQSLVEMSISMTLLAVVLAGVIDLGRAFYTYLALKDAANEGATYASICPPNNTDRKTAIMNRVEAESGDSDLLVSWNGVAITTDPDPDVDTVVLDVGDEVEVTVEVQYQLIAPFIGGLLGTQSLPLRATVVNTVLNLDPQYCQN